MANTVLLPTSRVKLGLARAGLLSIGVVALAGAIGCAGSSDRAAVPPVGAAVHKVQNDLVEVSRSRTAILWVKPDHHIGRYDDVLINVAGFLYGSGQDPLSSKEEREIRAMLGDSVVAITEAGPVGIANRTGECVVRIDVGLKDLRLHSQSGSGSTSSYISSYGQTTMIVEFSDSMSNELLVRYLARRNLGGGPGTGLRGADLNRLGKALASIMTEMTKELQTIVPTTTQRVDHDCKNGIYRLTGRG